MGQIQVLDQITIDKIAAGEVIERPASVVKELVENAVDAGAKAIVTEIQEGGISLIRISDNGCGIEKEDIANAFLSHSTSKIRKVEDLLHVTSLGFRGEALSSIAAVSQVELRTKTRDAQAGTSYRIEGGLEVSMQEMGVPDGTTFYVHQLFYNTPARRKFLKTPATEASHINELLVRLALSHPEISFQFINNGQTKMHTSGNGRLKDVIYHIYGRETAANLLEIQTLKNGMSVCGFLGKPVITRGNRNYENYFINGRYIKNSIISKAIEDAYKDFSMQHKYPFVVLHFVMPGETIDVNVHPTKMELRFSNQQEVYRFVYEAVSRCLHGEELIPEVTLPDIKIPGAALSKTKEPAPKEAGTKKTETAPKDLNYFMEQMQKRVRAHYGQEKEAGSECVKESGTYEAPPAKQSQKQAELPREQTTPIQMNLFEEKLLKRDVRAEYKIVGQVFDTYWIVELQEKMYIIDQHAAHERILYEKTLQGMQERSYTSQYISPPIVLTLSMQEEEQLVTYMDQFTRIGFELEPFGTGAYAIRAVPDNLFSIAKKDLFLEMLDSLSDELGPHMAPELIDEKIASMSCKAAVKGNERLSFQEVDALIGGLLTLENPYHCPHGRPTMIEMSKRELEKKFKRII